MPVAAYRIALSFPELTLFSCVNFIFSAIVSLLLIYAFFFRNRLFFRFSFALVFLMNLFFQWPLFVMSDVVSKSLDDKYWLFFVVQGAVISLLAFSVFSDKNERLQLGRQYVDGRCLPRPFALLSLVLLGGGLVYLFLRSLPFNCTALYAMFTDPELVLLAREISVKFNESRLAVIAYGVFANVAAPALIGLSVLSLSPEENCRRPIRIVLACICIVLAVSACLLTGTKGLLLPSLITVCIAVLVSVKGFVRKIGIGIMSGGIIFTSLVVFEIVRDRGGDDFGAYPYGICSDFLGGYEKNQELIYSLYHGKHSLFLSEKRLDMLHKELNLAHGRSAEVPKVAWEIETRPKDASNYFYSIIYRAFITPFQVAVWHFLYVEKEKNPGWLAMPLAKYLLGDFFNMPENVYQKYGSVFSGGDKTSTSTAPVGFMLGYPAYIGIVGLFIALLAVMIVDVVMTFLLMRSPDFIFPVGVGLLYVIAFNFLISDFLTSMVSHGGFFVFFVMVFFIVVEKIRVTKNC